MRINRKCGKCKAILPDEGNLVYSWLETHQCPKCKSYLAEVGVDAEYSELCSECGEPQEEQFCLKCGNEHPPIREGTIQTDWNMA